MRVHVSLHARALSEAEAGARERQTDRVRKRKRESLQVETIGDAWMGVTNLAVDQPDHAARIAR